MTRILAVMGYTPAQVRSRDRSTKTTMARAIVAHMLASRYPFMSLSEIGEMIGGRDHPSVIYLKRKVSGLLDVDKMFTDYYLSIIKML